MPGLTPHAPTRELRERWLKNRVWGRLTPKHDVAEAGWLPGTRKAGCWGGLQAGVEVWGLRSWAGAPPTNRLLCVP